MTLLETKQCLAVLMQFYPQFHKGESPEEALTTAKMWQSMFPEDDGKLVLNAIRMFIASDSKGFPPSVGQIREKLVKLQNTDMLGETEAWALVSKAIKNSKRNLPNCRQRFSVLYLDRRCYTIGL